MANPTQSIAAARAAPAPKKTKEKPKNAEWKIPPQSELLILWAISNADNQGIYGLDIQRAIAECSDGNESISVGTLYSLLKRLRGKGYIDSVEGAPLGGGARRQYYHLTSDGQQLISAIECFIERLQQWRSPRTAR